LINGLSVGTYNFITDWLELRRFWDQVNSFCHIFIVRVAKIRKYPPLGFCETDSVFKIL